MMNTSNRFFFNRLGILLASVFVCACSDIDNFHDRATIVNKGAAEYYNEAILLNIVRASKFEPLTFLSLGAYTGHNTVTGNVGFPTVTIGPHTPASPTPERNYGFGPNSVTKSVTNDFVVNVTDDPATYAALLAPTNPATIGFFINQGFSRELLFMLFVDRMIITDMRHNITEEYRNTPFSAAEAVAPDAQGNQKPSYQQVTFECFQTFLAFMVREGFTAETDVDAVPAGRTYIPANRFCADQTSSVWFRADAIPPKVCTGILRTSGAYISLQRPSRPNRLSPLCRYETHWTEAKAASPTSSSSTSSQSGSGGTQTASVATAKATSDTPIQVTMDVPQAKGQTVQAKGTADRAGTPVTVTVSAPISTPKQKPSADSFLQDPCTLQPSKLKVADPRAAYEMCIDGYIRVKLYLRSAYGVYEYLGGLLERKMDLALYTGTESDTALLTITNDVNFCFTSTQFESDPYCVPVNAENTKRIFSLLRQLVALNTTAQTGQPTLTVRALPE